MGVKQAVTGQHDDEDGEVVFVHHGKREQQKSSGGKNACKKGKEAKHVKAVAKKKEEMTDKIICHNCGKYGHY